MSDDSGEYPIRAWNVVSRFLLIAYCAALFTGTHWPRLNLEQYPQNTDKLLHFSAYAGLAVLSAFWQSTKRRMGFPQLATIYAMLAGYAVIDEITQIPVGRSCDVWDALADWIGCIIGLSLFAAADFVLNRLRKSPPAVSADPGPYLSR